MMWLDLKYLEPSPSRGFLNWLSLMLIALSLTLIWDYKVGMLGLGISLYIDTCVDEVVERFSLIKRKAKQK